ncbi:MAG: PEP-CTERM sorting domain-containing protein [Phycisphaerales bacterium]|nr:PEP-CTERM sorting domain-containing protein [Phycisphaerales bacterium]MCB9836187.1 PEP-CTERM sorting domain-containing protein [Phycisphaera sp.]
MKNTLTVCAAIAAGMTTTANAQTIINPDLTGPVASSTAPTDWYAWTDTADTCDASGPFNYTGNPWVLSPNGGTFVRGGANDFGVNEGIAQVVTGFVPGQIYTLEFYTTNLGFQNPSTGWGGADGFWRFFADSSVIGDTVTLSRQALGTDDISWTFGTLDFVAPAASFELAVQSRWAGSGTAAYMGIDGINVRLVPAPGSFGLLALAGVGAMRRRR